MQPGVQRMTSRARAWPRPWAPARLPKGVARLSLVLMAVVLTAGACPAPPIESNDVDRARVDALLASDPESARHGGAPRWRRRGESEPPLPAAVGHDGRNTPADAPGVLDEGADRGTRARRGRDQRCLDDERPHAGPAQARLGGDLCVMRNHQPGRSRNAPVLAGRGTAPDLNHRVGMVLDAGQLFRRPTVWLGRSGPRQGRIPSAGMVALPSRRSERLRTAERDPSGGSHGDLRGRADASGHGANRRNRLSPTCRRTASVGRHVSVCLRVFSAVRTGMPGAPATGHRAAAGCSSPVPGHPRRP
jgi:hypothetical protein